MRRDKATDFRVIPPSELGVARFAVGTKRRPTSFIWRLWTHDDDAYLLPTSRPDVKFSMHGRVWKIDLGPNRHHFQPIPCQDAPGWIQGPAVFFCHVPYKWVPPPDEILSESRNRKNVRWFSMPRKWHLREFVVFFSNADIDGDELPPRDTTEHATQDVIGPLPLADGRRAWLRSLVKRIPDDRRDYLKDLRAS
ncbi:MAG: hypothetical protein ACREA0_32365, partial [bacterium]